MVQRSISIKDMQFPIAKSRGGRAEPIIEPATPSQAETENNVPMETGNRESSTPAEAQQNSNKPAQHSEDLSTCIRELRGQRKLTSATQFNVILDEPLKDRLLRASYEQKVKQTVIVRAAIDAFLKKAGY